MGCNTSKESTLPQNEDAEDKENQQPKAEADKEAVAVETKNAEKNQMMDSGQSDTKSSSAKTVTLHSNGTVQSGGSPQSTKENSKSVAESNEEQAATKIQAAFRGHKTRKSMKQPTQHEEREPTKEELENEFRLDDPELCDAATKIQASFRGHMSRKQQEKKDCDSGKTDNTNQEEELDIDLTDPDLNKAAIKIQASFRGHLTRKEGVTTESDPK